MKKLILASAILGCAVASQAVVVFEDGFETGDFSKWDGITGTGTDPGSVQNTTVYDGAFAAQMSGSTTTGVVNGRYKSISPISVADTVNIEFYMKLGAASGNNRHYFEARSYAGDTYGSGTLEGIFALGTYNSTTNLIATDGTISTSTNTNKWQFRCYGAGYANQGWFVLDQAANRTTDWTKFNIVLTATTVQVYVNDVVGLATTLSRGSVGSIDSLVFSSRLSSANNSGYFDNVKVTSQAVPEPMTLIGLGAGLSALALRRRKK